MEITSADRGNVDDCVEKAVDKLLVIAEELAFEDVKVLALVRDSGTVPVEIKVNVVTP